MNSSVERSELLSPSFQLPAAGKITLAFDALSFDQAGACLEGVIRRKEGRDEAGDEKQGRS
mgnify:CR=1 FL=1